MTAARKIEVSAAEYRKTLSADFLRLRTHFEDVCEALQAAGVREDEVRERALTVVRPELRAFLSVVLTRAPLDAIERSVGLLHDWSVTDGFIEGGTEEMQALIQAAVPEATWTKLASLDAKTAKKEDAWARWTSQWLREYSSYAGVKHEAGQWARFFAGVEAPEWIATAVKFAATVDAHYREAKRERLAEESKRGPLTFARVVKMKGGIGLRPEDAIEALRGSYQAPSREPPKPERPAAPVSPGSSPARSEASASMAALVKLRGKPFVVPCAAEWEAFLRWCHEEWTAIKADAAALVWTPPVGGDTAAREPEERAAMLASVAALAKLRGEPFAVRGAESEAFLRWCHDAWRGIQGRAARAEWPRAANTSSSPPPKAEAAEERVPPTPAEEEPALTPAEAEATPTPTLTSSLEARLAAMEDELRRLRGHVAFLELNVDMQARKTAAEYESLKERVDLMDASAEGGVTAEMATTCEDGVVATGEEVRAADVASATDDAACVVASVDAVREILLESDARRTDACEREAVAVGGSVDEVGGQDSCIRDAVVAALKDDVGAEGGEVEAPDVRAATGAPDRPAETDRRPLAPAALKRLLSGVSEVRHFSLMLHNRRKKRR